MRAMQHVLALILAHSGRMSVLDGQLLLVDYF